MTDDITLNKSAIIRRCLARVTEEFQQDTAKLDDFTIQDAIILNLLRACEGAIDLAMHHVADLKLGIPQHSRDAFDLLMQCDEQKKFLRQPFQPQALLMDVEQRIRNDFFRHTGIQKGL